MDAENRAGMLLPGIDPAIGEVVLTTLFGNPDAHPAAIGLALVRGAPDEQVAAELLAALWELLLCWDKGHLVWVEIEGQAILAGARRMTTRDAVTYGSNPWPMGCLLFNSPTSVTIDTGAGRKRVWIGADELKGVVVRQSEATALGNALIESFGGRIIDDRGPEAMKRSFEEQTLTKRARLRAQALNQTERLTVEANRDKKLRPGHARTALAEAFPGSVRVGQLVKPEGTEKVYEVDRRLNDSWVSIVAVEPGPASNTEASAWVNADGSPPFPGAGDTDIPPHVGFTDEPAVARGRADGGGTPGNDLEGSGADGEGVRDRESDS